MIVTDRRQGPDEPVTWAHVTAIADPDRSAVHIDGKRADFVHLDWTRTTTHGVEFHGTVAHNEGSTDLTGRDPGTFPIWLASLIDDELPTWARS